MSETNLWLDSTSLIVSTKMLVYANIRNLLIKFCTVLFYFIPADKLDFKRPTDVQ